MISAVSTVSGSDTTIAPGGTTMLSFPEKVTCCREAVLTELEPVRFCSLESVGSAMVKDVIGNSTRPNAFERRMRIKFSGSDVVIRRVCLIVALEKTRSVEFWLMLMLTPDDWMYLSLRMAEAED